METDWSVAAGGDDPLIVVPWKDEAGRVRFVDLRQPRDLQSASLSQLPEASTSPSLWRLLTLLNDSGGVLMTSKCDRWQMDDEERRELSDVLDAPVAPAGVASYVDVLMTHPMPMADFLLHEEWVRATALGCAALEHPAARLDLIVRPAQLDGHWGYGVSMYVYAVGANVAQAEAAWSAALDGCAPILRAAAEATMADPAQEPGLQE